MRRLLLWAALGGSLFAAPALAAEDCACGDVGCEHACSCSAGVCPLHRPGKPGPAAPGQGHRAEPTFDAKTLATLKGTVKAVERHPHGPGRVGVHLVLRAGAETVTVHLGPADFVDPRLSFAAGDAVQVSGSRLTFEGVPTLLATVVKKGATTLQLRGPDGTPTFRGPPGR